MEMTLWERTDGRRWLHERALTEGDYSMREHWPREMTLRERTDGWRWLYERALTEGYDSMRAHCQREMTLWESTDIGRWLYESALADGDDYERALREGDDCVRHIQYVAHTVRLLVSLYSAYGWKETCYTCISKCSRIWGTMGSA